MFNFYMNPTQSPSVEGEIAMYDKIKEVIEWTWDFVLTKVGYYQEEDYVNFNEEESVHGGVPTEAIHEEGVKDKGNVANGDIEIEITPIEDIQEKSKGRENLIVTYKNDNVINV